MNKIRITLFWIFTLTFLVVCPTVVLYALGYLKTGLVIFKVTPPKAEITMANRIIRGPWPRTVSRIAPGTYEANIFAPGFAPQKRHLSIQPGKATMLDQLLLLPEPLEFQNPAGNQSFSNLMAIDGLPHVLLESGTEGATILHVFDQKSKETRVLLPKDSPYSGSIKRIDTAQASPFALVWFDEKVVNTGILINFSNTPPEIRTEPLLIGKGPLSSFWDVSLPGKFFVADLNRMYRVFEKKSEKSGFGDFSLRGFGIGNGQVNILDQNCQLRRVGNDGIPLKTVEPTPETIKKSLALFGEEGFYRIIDGGIEGQFYFLGSKGKLLQNQLPHKLEESGISGMRVVKKQKRAVVWKGDKAGVIDEPDSSGPSTTKGSLEPGREINWFYQNGVSIRSVDLIHDGSHALILDQARVLLIELFGEGEKSPRILVDVLPETGIAWFESTGTLYFIDPANGLLTTTKLFSKPAITMGMNLPDPFSR